MQFNRAYSALLAGVSLGVASFIVSPVAASQNLSSLMVEIRQQEGIATYYNLATGMALNGQVTLVRDNQGYTLGEFAQGVPNGRWQVFLPNNQKLLDGEYVNGLQSGRWQLFSTSGELSEEQFYLKGVPSGEWVQYDDMGNRYQKTVYEAGVKTEVLRYFASGKLQAKETYVDNLRHGIWETYHGNGVLALRQQYANNQLSGPYLAQNSEGLVIEQGRLDANGERQGRWQTFYDDGTPERDEYYAAGRLHGESLTYYPNGQLSLKGQYSEGLRQGTLVHYGDTGVKLEEENYLDGKHDGPQRYFNRTGILVSELNYKAGLQAGVQKTYYDDGKAKKVIRYHEETLADNGQYPLHGMQQVFDTAGNLVKTEDYDLGLKDGNFERYRNGRLQRQEQWRQGARHGDFLAYYDNGNLRSLDQYQDNRQTGKAERYFDDGTLKERGTRIEGQWVGKYEAFYETGKPRELLHYGMDKRAGRSRYPLDGEFSRWYANGDLNEAGEYKNGEKQGTWRQYRQGLVSREMTFEAGKLNGPYREFDNGRRRVTGSYQADRKEGKWTEYRYQQKDPSFGPIPEGNIYRVSHYHEDTLEGERAYYSFKQVRYRSEQYQAGELSGHFSEYYSSNGQLKREGQMLKGSPEGLWQSWFEDGVLAESAEYQSGKRHGEYAKYYPNGQLQERAHYRKDRLSGEQLSYFQTGKLKAKELWLDGQREGEASYFHANGKQAEQGAFLRSRREGLWRAFWPNGELRSEGSYIADREAGDWAFYDQFGKLIKTEHH